MPRSARKQDTPHLNTLRPAFPNAPPPLVWQTATRCHVRCATITDFINHIVPNDLRLEDEVQKRKRKRLFQDPGHSGQPAILHDHLHKKGGSLGSNKKEHQRGEHQRQEARHHLKVTHITSEKVQQKRT